MASTQKSYQDSTYIDQTDPAEKFRAVAPSDATVFASGEIRGLRVFVPSSLTSPTITIVDHEDQSLTLNLIPGSVEPLPVRPKKIMATGTTAGLQIVRFF